MSQAPHEVIARRERERELANLDIKATELYDNHVGWRGFQEEFTPAQLQLLWDEFCILTPEAPYGAAYDDEVADAIAMNERK